MTYHELMAKIKELPGWTWECKTGDRVWVESVKQEGIVLHVDTDGLIQVYLYGNLHVQRFAPEQLTPLPSGEQLDKKFREFDDRPSSVLYIDGHLHSNWREPYFASWDNPQRNHHHVVGEDFASVIAILYARVVLGYKLEGKEFVKC